MSTQSLSSTETREIVAINPANGEEIGRVPLLNASDVNAAVARARQAQVAWSKLSFRARARFILKVREIVLAQVDEIALLIARETGKPPAEAIAMEITPTLDLMQVFARNAERMLQRQKIGIGQFELMGRSSYVVYKPLGVVGI